VLPLLFGASPAWATASNPHGQPGLPCNNAMTPAETVLAFQQALELRDDSAFVLVAEDFIQHAAGPQGREGFRRTLTTLDHDLDHPTAAIHRIVAQDDLVVVQLTMHGHHVASTMPLLADLPPTGDAVAWDFIHIWRVADGSIIEHWACRDDVGLLAQVGGWPQSR
jgi:predicted ester cyclase